jgi:hypothetical protein
MMRKYVIHYRLNERYWSGVLKGKRTIAAKSEAEAVARVRYLVPDSFGHFVEV